MAVPEQGEGAFDNRGFTLIELLVVCIILGILVTLSIPTYNELINVAKVSRAAEEIRGLEKDIAGFQADQGKLPPDLAAIHRDTLLDPWGHGYVYHDISGGGAQYEGIMNPRLNTAYDLYSLGADNDTTMVIPDPDTHTASSDDIVRATDGAFVGLAAKF